ncbi:MAG: molybdenum cofactor guanylyltransferase [Acidimicrobiia bacterium]
MLVGGLLLTGGESTRLGFAKAELRRGGERLVDRGARVLSDVCDPVIEVGSGFGQLTVVQEDPPGSGPLAGVAAGAAALQATGHHGAALVLAVDLPFVEPALLAWLAAHPAPGTVVPRVDGMEQSLCARYSPDALNAAGRLVAAGQRSMRALLAEVSVTYLDEDAWSAVCDAQAFADIDTPEDQARFGVSMGE